MSSSKDARRALLIAKRIGYAAGGLPLLGEPVNEEIMGDEEGKRLRRWVPQNYAPGALMVRPTDPQNVISSTPAPPVYKSVTHDLLADPNSLGGMKSGLPQQWVNKLGAAGAKKEEMLWLGMHEGHPNTKVSREEMLARAKKRLPKISDSILGEKAKEKVLISGDPDAEDVENDWNPNPRWGEWTTGDPDSSYIRERAQESLENDLGEKLSDPDWAEPHVHDALEKFSEKHLKATHGDRLSGEHLDPNAMRPERVAGFVKEALDNGWVHHNEAAPIIDGLKNGSVHLQDWNKFVERTTEGVSDNFNKPETLPNDRSGKDVQQPLLPEMGRLNFGAPETETYLKPFEDAVKRLHGFRAGADLPMKQAAGDITTDALPGYLDDTTRAPDLMGHLHNHIMDDEDTLRPYEEMEERQYYDDDESPATATLTIEGADGEPEYEVHRSYGEHTVHAPNGRRIATTHSQDEAEEAAMNHALDNYGSAYEENENAPKYETRDIPQDNMTVPEASDRAKFGNSGYQLPGMINYREVPIKLEPREGGRDFTRSHYDDNTLGHMRVGEVRDEQNRRLLHIDEAQSDWHQKGNDEGYFDPQKHAEAEAEYNKHRNDLGDKRRAITAALGLPEEGDENNEYNTQLADYAAHALQPNQGFARDHFDGLYNRLHPNDKKRMFGDNYDEVPFNTHHDRLIGRARRAFGDEAAGLGASLSASKHAARKAAEGMDRGIPDAPWKDTGDFGRLMMRRALRMAADYGYDGISLSPGWVQSHRWSQDHNHLYDNILGGAMEGVAKEANRHAGTDLKREHVKIPLLKSHAFGKTGVAGHEGTGTAHAILFHKPENVEKVRKNSMPLFKRGGLVPTAKDARRAVLIAKAGGGPVLNALGMYSAATEAARHLGQAKAPGPQMYRTLQKVPGVKQDELDRTGVGDWLNNEKGHVAREDIAAHLAKNELPVSEIVSEPPDTLFGPGAPHGSPVDGGKDYKEVRWTLPRNLTGGPPGGYGDFYSPNPLHYKEPNIIAHARFDTRETPDGKKIMHVTEIQSDWAKEVQRAAMKAAGDDKAKANQLMRDPEFLKKAGLPPHPFPTAWHEFAMKRLLRHAAETGHDGLSWDTGETQSNRYDLSRQVDALHYLKSGDGKYSVWGIKDGRTYPVATDTAPGELDKHVGHDMAQKMLAGVGTPHRALKSLEGDDLKMGTEGMKNFYDQIVPAYVNRLAGKRRWNAKTEPGAVGNHPAHAIMFSPEMKASLMAGVPMRRGGVVRLRRAGGGRTFRLGDGSPPDWNRPPLDSDTPVYETTVRGQGGGPARRWIPQEDLEHPALAQSGVFGMKPSAPVMKSKVEDLLQNHDLDAKKAGNLRTPGEWAKALTKYGAKSAEIKDKGLADGDQRISREDMLALAKARRWPMRATTLRNRSFKSEMQGIDYDPYTEPYLETYWHSPKDMPDQWAPKDLSHDAIKERVQKKMDAAGDAVAEDPRTVMYNADELKRHLLQNWLKARSAGNKYDVEDSLHYHSSLRRGPTEFIDPNNFSPSRLNGFINEMVTGGYSDLLKAAPIIEGAKKGRIDLNDWNTFVKDSGDGMVAALKNAAELHKKAEAGAPFGWSQHGLPGMGDEKKLPTTTEIVKPYQDAIARLHGLAPSKNDSKYIDQSAPGVLGQMRAASRESARYKFEDEVQKEWMADPHTPRRATLSLRNERGNRRSMYGVDRVTKDPETGEPYPAPRYQVSRPEFSGSASSPDEAEQLAIQDARDNGRLTPEPREIRTPIPVDNVANEETEGEPNYGEYRLMESTNPAIMPFFVGRPSGGADGYLTGGHYHSEGDYSSGKGRDNFLMHGRTSDVTHHDDGRKFLYGEEAQADAQTKGPSQGYYGWDMNKDVAAARAELPNVSDALKEAKNNLVRAFGFNPDEYSRNAGRYLSKLVRVPMNPKFLRNEHLEALTNVRELLEPHHLEKMFGSRGRYSDSDEEAGKVLKQFQEEVLGKHENAKEIMSLAKDAGALEKKERKLQSIVQGGALPPVPWQDSSDWPKAIIKTMLRRAADFSSKVHPEGYHGFALSPGWVQAQRWAGEKSHYSHWNHGHTDLYDVIIHKALKEAAAEKGIPLEKIPIREQRLQADDALARLNRGSAPDFVKEGLAHPSAHHAWGVDFDKLDPAIFDKIRNEPFNEYKRGGAVNHEPSAAQKEAGNYKKEHVSFQGLNISIENKKGSVRRGIGKNGTPWACTLPADYGYIKRTEGADGDHVDAYIGPNKDSKQAFVINQHNDRDKKFDEHKIMLGYDSEREAAADYLKAFSDGKGHLRLGSLHPMSIDALKQWLKSGKTKTPAAGHEIVGRALALTHKYLYKSNN